MATRPIAAPLVSVEEYLGSNYEPDCEYNEGVLEGRNVGEFDHSFLQLQLGSFFTVNAEVWNIVAFTEWRLQLGANRFVIPDITVLRMGSPREPILTRPPLIAIEIMSPSDRLREVADKTVEYLDFGVEHIWVIDPVRRRAYRGVRPGDQQPDSSLELVADGLLTIPDTPIEVNVFEFLDKLDRF